MNERLQTELELLSRWYLMVRSATLRVLRDLEQEDFEWQPGAGAESCGCILARIAVSDELWIQRRLIGRKVVPDSVVQAYRSGASPADIRECVLTKDELELLLKNLKVSTLAFLRGLVFGRHQAKAPDVREQLEKTIFRENQCLGQIHYLRRLRSGEPETRRRPLAGAKPARRKTGCPHDEV